MEHETILYDVTVSNGKYRYKASLIEGDEDSSYRRYKYQAWRHGGPWEAGTDWLYLQSHNNGLYCIMTDLYELQGRMAGLEK